jgi:hypothetical protein
MNRLWLRSSALLLCLAQFITASKLSLADEQAVGEKLLPKETLAFFTISDVPEFKEKWEKTSMGQMLRDPQMQPFLELLGKKIDEKSSKVEEELGVTLKDLLDLPQGELTLAVMEQPPRKLSVVLMMEYGESQSTIDKLLKKMDEALDKAAAEHTTEEVSDVTLHIYALKQDDENNPFKTLTYFTDESYLVISSEVAAIKEVLERWEGDSDDTLAANDQFKYIQAQCKVESGDPLVKWYISPIGLIQSGIAMAQATIPQAGMAAGFLPVLGVDGWKGWGGSIDFDEGDFEGVANAFLYVDGAKGLMGVFNFPAVSLAPPKWVPANVGSYVVANWNVLGAYTAIETLIDSFQGRGSTARILESAADQAPNVHWKKDLIDHLDGKIHFLQAEPKEAEADEPPTPMMLIALGLKDAAKMKKTLAAIAKSGENGLETRDFNGETIYEIAQPGADQSVSITVTEGQLVVTNDTPLLEGMMRGATGRESLVDSPDYKKIAKFIPAKTSMLSFQRSDVQFKTLYNLLKNADANALDGLDVSKLPPFEVLAKYLQSSGGYTIPDKKGSKSVTYSLKRSE